MIERLADLIRPAIAYRPGVTAGEPPAGAADGEGFVVTVAMTSLTGLFGRGVCVNSEILELRADAAQWAGDHSPACSSGFNRAAERCRRRCGRD
jgi:hypothetical protein